MRYFTNIYELYVFSPRFGFSVPRNLIAVIYIYNKGSVGSAIHPIAI